MRGFLCKVSVVLLLLCGNQTAAANYGIGEGIAKAFKIAGVTIVGAAAFGLFTGVRGCMRGQALNNPDFLQMRGGGFAVNHYSNISRYDIEKEDPDVQDYLKIADEQDIELTLHLRDGEDNSSIATFIDLDGNMVAVKRTAEDGGGDVVAVPLTQVSGVALYDPDIYGHYVAVNKDKLIPLYAEYAAELSYFPKYHALVLASFSDNYQLLRVFAAIDADETVDNDGWLLGFDKGIDVMVSDADSIYRGLQLE